MDITWTDGDEAFRDEVRGWLRVNMPKPDMLTEPGSPRWFTTLRAWESELSARGYGALSWPEEYGGAGATIIKAAIFAEEYERADAPQRLNYSALSLLGPTIMAAGTPEQKRFWLPRILSLDDIWCQGFSEPEAGSDLASLRTRAERRGSVYVVNGQKIWSSNGPYADHAFCLVRTDTSAPKHKGISYLLIDLKSPGVDVRPITQLDGSRHFAEIFFTDVEVPVANRIGDENRGWYVAMETLGFERRVAGHSPAKFDNDFRRLVSVLRWSGGLSNADYQIRLAKIAIAIERYKVHYYSLVSSDRLETQDRLGPLNKLLGTNTSVPLFQLGMDALQSNVELGDAVLPDLVGEHWHHDYWYARASQIFAGTSQIQRDIIARRALDLPRGES